MLVLGNINSFAQDGGLDTSFDPGTGVDNAVLTTAIQTDGKIIIGGDFTNHIARLDEYGNLDASFNSMGSGANGRIWSIAIQSDGKILIGGEFTSYNGNGAIKYFTRLKSDGTLDDTFNVGGSGVIYYVNSISIQDDGKIIIGGLFSSYNGTSRSNIARLLDDGTLDDTFNNGGGGASGGISSGQVLTTAIQADGKILIGGYFKDYKGTAISYLARLLGTNGDLDTTFNTGYGPADVVRTISVQTDGKIIIGGSFASYNLNFIKDIVRLNANGTLDTYFNMGGTGAGSDVLTTSIQTDGKIIIGGLFSSYNGISISRIARLKDDGTLDDTDFDPGAGADGDVDAISIQSDGKIIIGGGFTTYNTIGRNYIARLYGSATAGINENNAVPGLSVYPNPAKDKVYVKLQTQAKYTLDNIFGQEVTQGFLISGTNKLDTQQLSNGLYFLNIDTVEGHATEKIIKN